MRHWQAWIVATVALLAAPEAALAKKLALVIGNDTYANLPRLEKAVGDAHAMGATLEDIGYEVKIHENLGYTGFAAALSAFEGLIRQGDEVVLHFSGHGVSVERQNFLLPVDIADVGQDSQLKRLAFDATELVESLLVKRPAWVFAVFDACRDNPFKSEVRGNLGRGLARIAAGSGAFVIHSAGSGQTARDRLGDNDTESTSVFTRILLRHMKTPGLTLYDLAKNTQQEVEDLAATVSHQQFPEIIDNVRGRPVLNGAVLAVANPRPDPVRPRMTPPPVSVSNSDPSPQPSFLCQKENVIKWLVTHGAYGDGKLDTDVYEETVKWAVNGKTTVKTKAQLIEENYKFRDIYPVRKYTLLGAFTTMANDRCTMSMRVDSYKQRSNGKIENSSFKLTFGIRVDTFSPRIVEQQIDILARQ